jgi:hypothetical protein
MRFLITLIIVGALVFVGATVKLGKRTFFGHVRAIWHTEEVQELKEGVKEKAGPTYDKVKRGVKKGYEEATKPEGSGSASPAPAHP